MPVPTEQQEQRLLAAWLDYNKILFCHVPNGGSRSKIEAAIFKGIGVKKGVPDIMIFTRPHKSIVDGVIVNTLSNLPAGVAIEMKRKEGSKTSKEQKEWIRELTAEGWICRITKGADEAIAFLQSLGYGKRQ